MQRVLLYGGGVGSDSQHAFHQLIMQGTHFVPVDFIYIKSSEGLLERQVVAQSRALAFGNMQYEENPCKRISGNIPSNIISLSRLAPRDLGTLIALYEYRAIFSGWLWRINPFDQFGVELGKNLSNEVLMHE